MRTLDDYARFATARADEWWSRASCRIRDVETGRFYVTTEGEQREIADLVCTSCPVRFECLEYALLQPETYGVWGGATENQRNRLTRLMRATFATQKHQNSNGYRHAMMAVLEPFLEGKIVSRRSPVQGARSAV